MMINREQVEQWPAELSEGEDLLPPVHPGEVLSEDFLKPLKISANKLAQDLRVPATRVGDIIHRRRGITADTALRLARYFGTSARFGMNLQVLYDLEVSERQSRAQIERDVYPREAA